MTTRDDVLRQALLLSPDDQAFVADMLEQQMCQTATISTEIAEQWAQEIDRRIDAYDRGQMASLDLEQSIQQLRKEIADHRTAKDAT